MRAPRVLLLLLLPLFFLLWGCGRASDAPPETGFDWERMIEQPRYDAYEPTELFPDGAVMRPPPPGTVPRHRLVGPPALVEGRVEGDSVARVPLALTRADLETGRHHFEIVCGACHGRDGQARTPVAEAMELRPPPSLLSDRIRRQPDGAIYRVILEGYGLMPSYAAYLDVHERWSVVAYLRALQWSQGFPLEELPDRMRREQEAAVAEAE